MKSVKVFLAMLVVLMLCGQAQAALPPVLDFEAPNLTQDILNTTYGSEYGVSFSGWGFSDDFDNEAQLLNKGRGVSTGLANITFDISRYTLESIDYAISGSFTYQAFNAANTVLGSHTFTSEVGVYLEDVIDFSSLIGLSLLQFTATAGSYLYIDDVTLSQVPVPGAAILLASGLLGLVGLRRKQLA